MFLAADRARLQDLDEALRKYLAWSSILAEKEILNLDPHQVRQAETQRLATDGAITARLPETYQWVLVPEQKTPQAAVTWEATRLTGSGALAERASKKLRSDELLLTALGASIQRMHMDNVPLWRGDSVAVKQLVDDFARYLYLPRLAGPEVLVNAIRDGLELLTWQQDSFAYAESYDETAARYRGLRSGQVTNVVPDSAALLVKSDLARRQMDAEAPAVATPATGGNVVDASAAPPAVVPESAGQTLPRRFHGTVRLDEQRVGRDAGRIAEEVIAHLSGIVGARVRVTLEIEAELPGGAPEQIVRTVTENSRTLKFTNQGFEKE